MTRIALIPGTYLPERCGVAQYTAHLCAALSEYCIQSVILTTYSAAEAAYAPNAIGVVHGWRLADLRALAQAVRASGADLLHIQHAASSYGFQRAIFLLPLLLRATGWRLPIVTTVHEYGQWEWQPRGLSSQLLEWLKLWGQRRSWWDREDGFLLTLSNAAITTNADVEAVIRKRLPKLTNRTYHIPNAAKIEVAPIDRAIASSLLRKNCRWPEEAIAIAFFGFLHPVKGLETLLPAFKQVVLSQPRSRLLLIGGVESLSLHGQKANEYWTQLHALVTELDLSHVVHLTGYVSSETASHYLSGADIGVLPSNQGITLDSGSLLTLWTHGLPVVATQHANSLPDAHPVKLVPPRDIDALATGLLELLNDADERTQLGEAGRAFMQNFSWYNVARSHLKVYQTVMNNTNSLSLDTKLS